MEYNTFNVPTFIRLPIKNCSFTIRPTKILFACLLLSCIMTCARAAPSPRVVRVPPLTNVPDSRYDYNPCGENNIEPKKALRHSRALHTGWVLRDLELSLKHTLYDFNHHDKSKISIQYNNMNMTKHFVDKILLKNQYAEFGNFKSIQTNWTQEEMVEHILVDLRGQLKFFGKAFDELYIKTVSTDSSSFSISNRTSILNALRAKLKSLSCVVETGISAAGNAQDAVFFNGDTDVLDCPSNPNTTTIMILDMSTFTLYKNFLQDWIKVVKKIKSMNRSTKAIHKASKDQKNKYRPTQESKERPTRSTKGTELN